jgi:protein-S-isoprenylcysteine O-methyltransferase Ste14
VRKALLAALFVLPLLLALAVKAEDNASQADTTLPLAIYYIIFLFVLAGAAGLVWTFVLAARWTVAKLKIRGST